MSQVLAPPHPSWPLRSLAPHPGPHLGHPSVAIGPGGLPRLGGEMPQPFSGLIPGAQVHCGGCGVEGGLAGSI